MRRRPVRRDPGRLAGWVFADLMLALTLVGLATGVASPAPNPTDTTTTTTTTLPARPEGLSQQAERLEFKALTGRIGNPQLQQELADKLAANPALAPKRIGMALIFGHSATLEGGQRLAAAFQTVLQGNPQFAQSAFRVIRNQGNEGDLHVEIFPFVELQ